MSKNDPYRLFFETIRKNWLIYSLGMLAMLITSISEVMLPKFIQWSIEVATSKTQVPEYFMRATPDDTLDALIVCLLLSLTVGWLVRNPKVLILDEATANVDEPCEALIQKAIVELLQGRTCFIIAHRLSTIRHCDRILVFHQGSILEEGPHDELLEKDGHYAELVRRQIANAYI